MSKPVIDFLYNLDRAGASVFGAPPQETISSELGRAKARGAWWGRAGSWVLNKIQPGHTDRAIAHANALDAVDNGDEK
jgi:hypothetical protein